jgi:PAS domain S-box-containing protein
VSLNRYFKGFFLLKKSNLISTPIYSRKLPLRVVLVVPFVLQVVGVVGITGYLSFQNGQQAVNQIAAELRREVAARVVHYLDTSLATPILINQINADAVRSGNLDFQNTAQLEQYLHNQLQQFNSVSHILVGTEQGMLRAVERQSSVLLWRSDPLLANRVVHYAVNSTGTPTQVVQVVQPFDVRARPWYQAAIAAGQPVRAPIFQLADNSDLLLSASQPVFDPKTGKPIGVFAAAADITHFRRFLQSLKIGQTGRVFILERNGLLVGNSSRESPYLREQVNGTVQFQRIAGVDSEDPLIRSTSRFLLARFGDFYQIQTAQQLDFLDDTGRRFIQILPYQDDSGLDWLIALVVPESDFMTEIAHNNQMTLWLCSGALIGAIVLGLVTAAWIASPILRLSRASRALALGKWDFPVLEESQVAELEVLTHSFNQMAERLQTSFDEVKTALRESESKFTKIFRNSPDLIAITKFPEGRYLEINEQFLARTGHTKEEVIGRTSQELGLVSDPQQLMQIQQQLQVRQSVHNIELDYYTKTGDRRALLASAEVMELEEQRCVLWVGRDITERNQAETLLRQSEARYLAILQDQSDLIVRCQRDGTLTFVNDAYCRYFGLVREEVIGTCYEPVVFAADRDYVAQQLRSLSQTNPVITVENRVITHQGQTRWTQWINRAIMDAQGQVIEIQCVGRDIDQLKQAEAALRESEARFRGAFDTATIGMGIMAPDGHFVQVNPAFCRMLGYPESELLQLTVRDITHPDDIATEREYLHHLLAGHLCNIHLEKRYIHKQGYLLWGLLSVVLVRDLDQTPLYFVIQMQDISWQKQAEAPLLR